MALASILIVMLEAQFVNVGKKEYQSFTEISVIFTILIKIKNMNYTGKEPCAGCGRTGQEAPRSSKNELCPDCKKMLAIGRDNEKILDSIKISCLTVDSYYFWRPEFNSAFAKLMDSISVSKELYYRLGIGQTGKSFVLNRSALNSSKSYYIPSSIIEPIVEYAKSLAELGKRLYCYEEELEKTNQKILDNERDKILNEGITMGRNLLFQLGRGEITEAEINKEVCKYSQSK